VYIINLCVLSFDMSLYEYRPELMFKINHQLIRTCYLLTKFLSTINSVLKTMMINIYKVMLELL
jgi:hypothetical protein